MRFKEPGLKREEIPFIAITATTSFEAGYVCETKKVKKIKDDADKRLTL
jgi:hypothetical protein